MHQKRLYRVMPGAWCDHEYPVEVRVYDRGRSARCLRCHVVGPLREDARAARRGLLEKGAASDNPYSRCGAPLGTRLTHGHRVFRCKVWRGYVR
jgi:hypothetical protein